MTAPSSWRIGGLKALEGDFTGKERMYLEEQGVSIRIGSNRLSFGRAGTKKYRGTHKLFIRRKEAAIVAGFGV